MNEDNLIFFCFFLEPGRYVFYPKSNCTFLSVSRLVQVGLWGWLFYAFVESVVRKRNSKTQPTIRKLRSMSIAISYKKD